MSIKNCIFQLLLLAIGINAFGQPSQTQAFLPKILPGSPEAAGIARYGNIPVNMYTGVPSITIPLYEIQVGELKVPISLNYHASGIKVTDIPSWSGLGWSVSAGGIITRKMMGKPDELSGNYLSGVTSKAVSEIDKFTQAGIDYLHSVVNGTADAEPDIYSYNLPGKSGKFLFNQRDNFNVITMPYDPITVTRSHPTQSTMLFSIIDESGIQYKFDTYEWTSTSTGSSNTNAISSWMLSKMYSSNKQDSITFTYTERTGSGNTDHSVSEFITVSDEVSNHISPPPYSEDQGSGYSSETWISTWWQLHNEILFKNGKVVFETSGEQRQDFNYGFFMPSRLSAIKIYNYDKPTNTYQLIRIIQFYHSYFISGSDATTKRLRLDSLSIKSSTGTEVEKYKFEYNTNQILPARSSKAKDYWGYFNNVNNTSLIPRMEIPFVGMTSTINIWIGSSTLNGREPDPNYMQANMLTKIHYPTGGRTEFEYETNKYLDAQSNVKNGGGLRIKKIKNYDGVMTNPIVKTYKYGQNESGNGRANFILNNYFFQTSQSNRYFAGSGCPGVEAIKRVRTFFSNPTIDIEPFDGSAVVYPYVTEYVGDETNNTGRTIYQFNDRTDALNLVAAYGRPIITSYHYNRGQLIDKIVQKKNSSGQYKKVVETTNAYEYFAEQWNSYLGLVVHKWRVNQSSGADNTPYGPYPAPCAPQEDSYSFHYDNYAIRTGDNRLKETNEIVYDENDETKSIVTNIKYYYDNFNHMQVTRIETVNGKGETILTTKKYPHEFNGTQPYTDMVTKKMWNRVVEEQVKNVTLSNAQLSKLTNNFYNWSNDNYLPASISLEVSSNSPETRAQFTKYDTRGSIQEMNKADDVKMVYIWDYQSMYPVAEIVNAAETEVAYTSFESDGKGNWTFSGTVLSDPSSITGKRSYNLSNGAISKSTGLSASVYYIVSYWTKNSSAFSITGTQSGYPLAGSTVNGWKLFVHKLYGITSISIGGTGFIDELRLHPEKAQMNSYTFEPLIGMTTKADANNRISYFDYDAVGRLKIIRDQNLNVRKVFCYNYAGQAVECNTIYKSAYTSQSAQRNNCGAGYTGSWVTYGVPADKYISTISQANADAKSQADIALNLQAYANANGTCIPVCTSCSGVDKQCINGVCYTGIKSYSSSVYVGGGQWLCTFRYYWSQNQTYSVEEYQEYSSSPCGID